MAELIDTMLAWLAANEGPLAYVAFAAASLLEYVVPPVPGDTIALFGIFLCISAGWSAPAVYAALNVGSVVGGMAAYAFGRRFRDVERRPAFLRGPRATAAFRALADRYAVHGAAYIALNRFVPALRAFFFVAAGISGLPAGRVAGWGLASALVWNGVLMIAGHLLGASFAELQAVVGGYGAVVLGVIVLVLLALAARALARRIAAPRGGLGGPRTTTPGAEAPGASRTPSSDASTGQQ